MKEAIKLFAHIGTGKTGSSVIQGFLSTNRKILFEKYGILYPDLKAPFDEGNFFNHAQIYNVEKGETLSNYLKFIEGCLNFLSKSGNNILLLSWENTKLQHAEWLSEAVKKFDLDPTLIIYLRRQDLWLESAWKQWGHKSEKYSGIVEYTKSKNTNWQQLLENWEAFFKTNQFIVSPYEASQLKEGIVSNFLNKLRLKEDYSIFQKTEVDYKSSNVGFNKDVIQVLEASKKLNRHIHDNRLFHFFYNNLPSNFLKSPFKPYNFFTEGERKALMKDFEPSNNKVAKKYLGREKLFIEPLVQQGEDNNKTDEPLSLNKAIPIIMSIAVNQNQRIEEINKAIKKKQKKSLINIESNCNTLISVYKEKRKRIPFTFPLKLIFQKRTTLIFKLNSNIPLNSIISINYKASADTRVKFYASKNKDFNSDSSNGIMLTRDKDAAFINLKNKEKANKLRLDFIAANSELEITNFQISN